MTETTTGTGRRCNLPPRRRLGWLAALFPLFVPAAALTLPMWGTAEYLCRFKVSDPAFWNTTRYMVRLIGTPLLLPVWAVLGFCFLPAWAAAVLPVFFLCSYSLFYDWLNEARGPSDAKKAPTSP